MDHVVHSLELVWIWGANISSFYNKVANSGASPPFVFKFAGFIDGLNFNRAETKEPDTVAIRKINSEWIFGVVPLVVRVRVFGEVQAMEFSRCLVGFVPTTRLVHSLVRILGFLGALDESKWRVFSLKTDYAVGQHWHDS